MSETYTVTDQELQRLNDVIKNAMGSFSDATTRVSRSLHDLASGIAEEDKKYDEHLKKLNRWNKAEDAERVKTLQSLRDHAKALKDQDDKTKAALDAARAKILKGYSDIGKLSKERAAALASGDTAAAKKHQDSIKEIIKARAQENLSIRELTKSLGVSASIQKSVVDKMRSVEKELVQFSWKDAGKKVGAKMASSLSDSIKSATSTLTVGKAISGAYNSMATVMATGGDNMLSSLSQQMDVIKLGLTPEEYNEMNKTNRRSILAAGGVTKQMSILDSQTQSLRGHFADVGSATKFTQSQMDILAKSGIKPTIANAGLLTNEFKRMQSYTGMTGDEFSKITESMVMSEEIQTQLRAAESQDREQLIKTTMARVAEFTAMGMSTEQATKAAGALAKIAGQKPLDRIKQAAKTRAMGAAMGIDGNAAADAILAGQRATDEQKADKAKFFSEMSNKMSEAAMGSLQGEIYASAIQGKLGTADTDATSVFNTRLAEGMKISQESLDEQKKVPEKLQELINLTSQIKVAGANPAVNAVGGAGNSLLELFGSGAAGAAGGWLKGKLGGGVPGGGSVPGGVPGGSKWLSAGKVAGKVAKPLAVGIAGYEAYDAYNEHALGNISESERNAKIGAAGGGLAGMWAGAAMGGAAGTAFGGVGAIPGALIGGALGYWGGSEAGESLGGMTGDKRTRKQQVIDQAKLDAGIQPNPMGSMGSEVYASKLQEKLGTSEQKPTTSTALTSAETKAETASPIGLQLSKMEESNEYLKDITKLNEKQIELAEKLLAATIVSQDDKAALFRDLSVGNKFSATYNTVT